MAEKSPNIHPFIVPLLPLNESQRHHWEEETYSVKSLHCKSGHLKKYFCQINSTFETTLLQYHEDLYKQSFGRVNVTHYAPILYVSADTKFCLLKPLQLPQNLPNMAICKFLYSSFVARMNHSFSFSSLKKEYISSCRTSI